MGEEFYNLGKRQLSTKGLVRSILIEESPLTIKQIHSRIKTESKKPVSYQAVHKTIKELLEEESVLNIDKKYQLNPEWIIKGRKHFENLEERLYKERFAKYKEFNCLYDCYRYILEFGHDISIKAGAKEPAVLHLEHMYSILTISKEEYQMFETVFRKMDCYIACKNNTTLDNAMATFYRLGGMKIKLGAPINGDMDTLVIDGKIIQVLFPKKLKKELDTIYSKATVYNILQKNFFHYLYKNTPTIKVFIQENQALSDELISQTKRMFK